MRCVNPPRVLRGFTPCFRQCQTLVAYNIYACFRLVLGHNPTVSRSETLTRCVATRVYYACCSWIDRFAVVPANGGSQHVFLIALLSGSECNALPPQRVHSRPLRAPGPLLLVVSGNQTQLIEEGLSLRCLPEASSAAPSRLLKTHGLIEVRVSLLARPKSSCNAFLEAFPNCGPGTSSTASSELKLQAAPLLPPTPFCHPLKKPFQALPPPPSALPFPPPPSSHL
jgi:hypothetical protein